MPDYLDDLVASLNGVQLPAEQLGNVPELPETPAEPPGEPSSPNAPGPAGGPQEPRPESLEVPGEIRAEPEKTPIPQSPGPAGAPEHRREERLEVPGEIRAKLEKAPVGPLATMPEETAGTAAGPVEGRMMVVMPEENVQGMEALVGVVQSIALLGLPAGGVTTNAIGSKL